MRWWTILHLKTKHFFFPYDSQREEMYRVVFRWSEAWLSYCIGVYCIVILFLLHLQNEVLFPLRATNRYRHKDMTPTIPTKFQIPFMICQFSRRYNFYIHKLNFVNLSLMELPNTIHQPVVQCSCPDQYIPTVYWSMKKQHLLPQQLTRFNEPFHQGFL